MSPLSQICVCCVSDGVPRRSFVVALIVGTILNVINQGNTLLNDGNINLTKILLTYAVPYCVATYGAVSFRWATIKKGAAEHHG
ncbi:MAG: nitrate/nitrite transporter NrtS [Alphaproteobacteria bacterium]|nr:nitrate/nitrite transporter NrtS [Alphaproteobacteria bacterium]